MEKEVIILGTLVITPLLKAQKSLQQALAMATTDLERDGAIQRFEYTFELIWKTLKRILEIKGVSVNSPRDAFREAAKQKLIDDPQPWFEFLGKRNLTVHTYNEEDAIEIFACLPAFEKELSKAVDTIKKL